MKKIALAAVVAASVIGVPAAAQSTAPQISHPPSVLVCHLTLRGLICVDYVEP